MEAATSYENTIKTLLHTKRGSFQNLDYLPAFRASGVFYAVVNETTTTVVSFYNYWREKNDTPNVGCLASLRDTDGALVGRVFFTVERYTYSVDAREILEASDHGSAPFDGTLEIEIHSGQDLKFAFPALLVFYWSPTGVSSVHTNQRIYNNAEDQRRGDGFSAGQTGFDVSVDGGGRPVIFLANGPRDVAQSTADIQLFNAAGDQRNFQIDLGAVPALASRKLDLAELDGVPEFLGKDAGFAKLDVDLADIYYRFACGTMHQDGHVSITHSYFDCTTHDDYYDLKDFSDGEYPCFVPVNLIDGVETEVIFYPIQSPTEIGFSVQAFDENGMERASVVLPDRLTTNGSRQARIDLRKILKEAGVDDSSGLYCVHVLPHENRFPARMTFGLNYTIGGKPGTNISSSVLMASSHGKKQRAWLWGGTPVTHGGQSVIMLSHFSKDKADRSVASCIVEIYDAQGVVAQTQLDMPNGTGANIVVEELLEKAGYEAGDGTVLWYVAKSPNSNLIANQVHISSAGYVGGDHSF